MTHIVVEQPKIPVLDIPGAGREGDALVLYALQPKQYEAYRQTPLYRPDAPTHLGYGGAAGGGKSYLARAVACSACIKWPGCTGIIFRKTEDEVKENHVNKFREEVPELIRVGGVERRLYSFNAADLVATWYNNSRLYFGHLRHEEDVFKYHGNEYDFIVFEEATHYSRFQVTWIVNNRLRATRTGIKPFVLYPSNPGSKGHQWYKKWFIDRLYQQGEDPAEFAFVQAFVHDNAELMQRDPAYYQRLQNLPEPWRSWLMEGDFTAGMGLALPELHHRVHIIPPFEAPPHWPHFGAFDWGYAHPFSFGHYVVSEDGMVFKVTTVTGRQLHPHEIAERIHRQVPVKRLKYIVGGHDLWAKIKARGENTPSLAEQFLDEGIVFGRANIDRVQGLNNLRAYLAWKNTGRGGTVGDPYLRFLDNEANRRCFSQLEEMVVDPDDPEDVLKVDADEWGEGGDDMYDETRYAIASRPNRAPGMFHQHAIRAFDPTVLKHEAEQKRLVKDEPVRGRRRGPRDKGPIIDDPLFGDFV